MARRGPLRTYLRDDEDEQGHDDYLDELIARQRAMSSMPPPGLPAPRQVPTRQQPGFADFLTQALAGVGDAFNARAGRRSDTMGRVIGMQQGQREQAYQEELARSAAAYEADRMAKEDEWRRHQAEQSSFGREFDRAMKLREMAMFEKLAGAQRGQGREQAAAARRQSYQARLVNAATPKELQLEASKLKALNPEDAAAIDAAVTSLEGVMKIEKAQPSAVKEQIEASLGRGPSAWAGERFTEMVEPAGGRGLPVVGSERGYRWMYGTPGFMIPGLMDLSEAAGIVDWSSGPKTTPKPSRKPQIGPRHPDWYAIPQGFPPPPEYGYRD